MLIQLQLHQSSVEDVVQYVRSLNLNGYAFADYAELLQRERVNGKVFLQLTLDGFNSIGIVDYPRRKYFYNHIQTLNNQFQTKNFTQSIKSENTNVSHFVVSDIKTKPYNSDTNNTQTVKIKKEKIKREKKLHKKKLSKGKHKKKLLRMQKQKKKTKAKIKKENRTQPVQPPRKRRKIAIPSLPSLQVDTTLQYKDVDVKHFRFLFVLFVFIMDVYKLVYHGCVLFI